MGGGNWEESVLRGCSLHTCSGSAAFGFTEQSRKIFGGKLSNQKINEKRKKKNNPDGCVRERGALDGGNGARKYVSKGRAWLVLYV